MTEDLDHVTENRATEDHGIEGQDREIEGQDREIGDQNREIGDQNRGIEDQNREIEDQNHERKEKAKNPGIYSIADISKTAPCAVYTLLMNTSYLSHNTQVIYAA